jgi:hypothetical protein
MRASERDISAVGVGGGNGGGKGASLGAAAGLFGGLQRVIVIQGCVNDNGAGGHVAWGACVVNADLGRTDAWLAHIRVICSWREGIRRFKLCAHINVGK